MLTLEKIDLLKEPFKASTASDIEFMGVLERLRALAEERNALQEDARQLRVGCVLVKYPPTLMQPNPTKAAAVTPPPRALDLQRGNLDRRSRSHHNRHRRIRMCTHQYERG